MTPAGPTQQPGLGHLDGDAGTRTQGSGHADATEPRDPTPRVDGYTDLRAYAVLGDGSTVALVAGDGRIDWFPVPDLDTPPVFAALLDAGSGGYVELAPTVPFRLRRQYVVGTNVLVTTYDTADGQARVTQAMNTGVAGRLPWSELAVTGNRADGQLQLGVYGDVLAVVRGYVDAGNLLDAETGRLLASVADEAADAWHRPDAGMWELTEQRHYTSSKLGCWQALRCAVHLVELGQIPGDPDRWCAEADRIAEWVAEHCWSEERGAYLMHPGADALDASVLLHARSGFDTGERMSRTVDALRAELGSGPLLHRYTGMPQEEGAFVACAFWGVSALALVGREDEARDWMEELLALANDVGVWPEMIEPGTGDFLGNLPQALSHLALVQAALTLAPSVAGDD